MSTQTLGLSREQRQRFDERGLVHLEGLIPRPAVARMADRLWQTLEAKDGMRRRAPGGWKVERPFHFKALQASGAFKGMATPAVRAVLDDLMGPSGWSEPPSWGQPLVCFPTAKPWDVPFQSWHTDGPTDPGAPLIGRVFAVLEPLRARGGTTLVALGSHRLARRLAVRAGGLLSSAEVRKALKAAHPWFADLMSPGSPGEDRVARFMDRETVVDGVACQVEAMTGEPGDVLLMHPNVLHAGSSNALDSPRLVLSQFVTPRG